MRASVFWSQDMAGNRSWGWQELALFFPRLRGLRHLCHARCRTAACACCSWRLVWLSAVSGRGPAVLALGSRPVLSSVSATRHM